MTIGMTIKNDSTKNWERSNPVLSDGELGYDLTRKVIKIGDGETPWKGLKGVLEVKI